MEKVKTIFTTRNAMVRSIINDALDGETRPLEGLIHYLHDDLGYPLYRIAACANRLYHLPVAITYLNISELEN